MNNHLFEVVNQFKIIGNPKSIELYGSGHINITYLVVTDSRRYILQKINHNLFKEVDKLMSNITLVTEHITRLYPDKKTLTLVYTKSGKSFYNDLSGYYRIYDFIENSICLQIPENIEEFYESALAFGDFANMLATFDATKLYEIIPNFHNTESRYNDFLKAVERDKCDRKWLVSEEIEFILKRKDICSSIVQLLNSKKMPLKVTHNDTKLNNVLLDKDTLKGIAVIDLDTMMPGSICYDFGDSIRFGCNSSFEDEQDLSKVFFRMDMFEAYVKGYLFSLGTSITDVEKENLSNGAILMTLECGMRFLADYLDGDIYFRTSRENQNLDRCRTQLKLVVEMEKNYAQMNKIVNKYFDLYCIKK